MTNFARPRSSMLAVSAAVLLALSGAVSAEDVAPLNEDGSSSFHYTTDTTINFERLIISPTDSPIEISTAEGVTLKLNGNATGYSVDSYRGIFFADKLSINGNVEISIAKELEDSSATDVYGLYVAKGATSTTGSLTLNVKNANSSDTTGFSVELSQEQNFGGAITINIEAKGYAYGVDVMNISGSSPIKFAGPTTIKATSTSANAYGVSTRGGQLQFNGETNITAIGKGSGNVYGVSISNAEATFSDNATITATTEDTLGSAEAVGLDVSGASGLVTVNENSTLRVTGDTAGIRLNAGMPAIKVGNNATLMTNSVVTSGNQGGVKLWNNAKLVVTGGVGTTSKIGKLSFTGTNAAVEIGSGTHNIGEWIADNDGTVRAIDDLSKTKVNIENIVGDGGITLATTKEVNNQYDSVETTAARLAEVLTLRDGQSYQLEVASGDVNNGLTATVDEQGKLTNVVITRNEPLDAFSSIASLGIVSWRHEMNDLQKRLGELRMSPEGVGAWARLYGSEQEYGSQNVLSKSKSIQVGADTDVGNGWKVGGAFIYTDGDSHYDSGSADSDAYSLAVYGTWMDENGLFVDLIGKYTRMETDFKASAMKGSFDNNALSLSAEAGWHFKVNDQFFVEPQAELTWGRIKGDSFTASNGVKVEQDDTDSIIGRVGVRTGYYLPDNKGTVYARLSGVYDFDGETTNKASLGTSRNTFKEDLGGGWVEMGVGANYNVSDRAYVYADLQKTAGGEVKENWRWNVGMRYVF